MAQIPKCQVNTLREFLSLSQFEYRQLRGAIDDTLRLNPELISEALGRGTQMDNSEFCRRISEGLEMLLYEGLNRKLAAIDGAGWVVYQLAMLRRQRARKEVKQEQYPRE
ncbi:hypothetical protein ABW21_db0209735 [Orbilia brochopaga]|nr:hypothetical protein ABW21_db0209735 [Drechslerella brochopaga]